MLDNLLFVPEDSVNTEVPKVQESQNIFITFISKIEGWKTRCKNLHWDAPRKNIHVYLDEFLEILSDYQDSLAEEIMGISGKIPPTAITGISPWSSDAWNFIKEVREDTLLFYSQVSQENLYAGVRSECETFIHNINKYIYLFNLCKKSEEGV